jgi:hypothetical protein
VPLVLRLITSKKHENPDTMHSQTRKKCQQCPVGAGMFPDSRGNYPDRRGNYPDNVGNVPVRPGNYPDGPGNFADGRLHESIA